MADEYNAIKHWGIVTGVSAYECDPQLIRSAVSIQEFIDGLCILIKMKKYGDAKIVHFGQDERVQGFSFIQLIETSSITGHFRNENNTAYIEIFSCKNYDTKEAAEFVQNFFNAKKKQIVVSFRE